MHLRFWFLIPLSAALVACTGALTSADVEMFQPAILVDRAPDRPLKGTWSLANNTTRVGLAEMKPLVPAFNGKGHLLASWNPNSAEVAGRPTFVIVHGGHGLVTTNFATALWLRQEFGANVLLLDSYWSRGREENWETRTRYGANMRALDAIAAARWLKDTQGVDVSRMFLYGDSQGGWTVLRTFTDEKFMKEKSSGLYRGGIALYPYCMADGTTYWPRLGPYTAPVIVFTGGKDTATPPSECSRAIFSATYQWTHYPDQTHGWDAANRGAHSPAVDGECGRAMNVYNRFAFCRSDITTANMRKQIVDFVAAVGR